MINRPQPLSYLQVLIVDNFESFRVGVKRIILDFGAYNVLTCATASEAVELCKHHEFDLIISDYVLGDPCHGQHLLSELRYRSLIGRKTLFVMITAETDRHIILSVYDYSPDDYIIKPISPGGLVKRLARLVHKRDDLLNIYHAIDAECFTKAYLLLEKKLNNQTSLSMIYRELKGRVLCLREQYPQAEVLYRRVLEMRRLQWAQLGLAKVKAYLGDHETAITWLSAMREEKPDSLAILDTLYTSYSKLDDAENSQRILTDAVEVSPLSSHRQQRLGTTALNNHDSATACEAFLKTIELNEYSSLNQRSHTFNFARSISLMFNQSTYPSESYIDKAISQLTSLDQAFSDGTLDEKAQRHLLMSQILVHLDDTVQANDCMNRAQVFLDTLNEPNIDTSLDQINTLCTLNKPEEAELVYSRLTHRYKHNKNMLKHIQKRIISPNNKLSDTLVLTDNARGILLYQQGKYAEAIECFLQALKKHPDHKGIQLNLIQSCVGIYERGETLSTQHFKARLQAVDSLLSKIKKTDDHFLRLKALLARLPNDEDNT